MDGFMHTGLYHIQSLAQVSDPEAFTGAFISSAVAF
jgi:hypothetical protein